jgi:hypothetical protein
MNPPANIRVDHRDHNGLNCQEYNMRNCTHQQNSINRSAWGSSKYLGVAITRSQTWSAKIKYNGECHHIGTFSDEISAAHAYDEMARIHHGEFANLNFKE